MLENGKIYPLSALKGKVVLVVNTATGCGFAPQLKGLEELSKSINASHPDSFVVLAFPSDHFNQEKRSGDALQEYCEMKYKASYPILGPVGLNGHPMKTDNTKDKAEGKEAAVDGGDALFEWMKKQKSGLLGVKKILWNFEKFLIGKDGKVKERWTSVATPAGMESRILAEVKKGTEWAKPSATQI